MENAWVLSLRKLIGDSSSELAATGHLESHTPLSATHKTNIKLAHLVTNRAGGPYGSPTEGTLYTWLRKRRNIEESHTLGASVLLLHMSSLFRRLAWTSYMQLRASTGKSRNCQPPSRWAPNLAYHFYYISMFKAFRPAQNEMSEGTDSSAQWRTGVSGWKWLMAVKPSHSTGPEVPHGRLCVPTSSPFTWSTGFHWAM